jgi:RNA polymerase sigma factor (TIGR02999 family)
MASERPGHTLSATALVHDVYLKLAATAPDRWADAAHFYAAAAEAMRHLLVDHARARLAAKRGSGAAARPLTEALASVATVAESADPDQVLALDHAVTRLDAVSPDAAAVVRLRFYAGLSVEATAAALALSPATVKRKWAYARAWLFPELSGGEKQS